VRYSTVY
jgi:hypothetical protein